MTPTALLRSIVAAGFVLAAVATAAPVAAQPAYPSKPITFIVPQPPGGTSDVLARLIGQKLTEAWGQPVVIEHKPGAAGNIGAAFVAKSAPDGYTLLIAPAAISTAGALYKDPGFKLFETLTPVTLVGTVPFMLVVHPSLPVTTVAQFLDYARKNPGKLSLGSGGNGTVPHLGGELLKMQTGIDFTHVPYKGGIQSINDLVGGQIQFTIDGGSHVVAQVDAGKLRLIAVTTARRLPAYPDVPTVAEAGGKDFDMTFWYAFMAPAGTPVDVINKLNSTIDTILRDKDVRARLAEMSLDIAGGPPAKVTELIRSDAAKWKKVIDEAGIKVD